jgi:hypothetical protein
MDYIGKYVIFESFRTGCAGKALGKIVACTGQNVEIERIDLIKDYVSYSRNIMNDDISVLDTENEFLARLQF